MKKIYVNKEECIGCGFCIGAAPDNFEYDEDGLSKVKTDCVDSLSEEVATAIENCPTGAIKAEETN